MEQQVEQQIAARTDEFFARVSDVLAPHTERVAKAKAYRAALFEAGLAGLEYPIEYGGADLPATAKSVFLTAAAGRVPLEDNVFGIGTGMALPTILKYGTAELKERFLEPGLRGDHIWCQMYSEPGAGSDLAGLTTRAERTDVGWVLNGQKVWTSLAREADFAICLARTDRTLPKHRGITMFVLPMDQPGVTVRPLVQITGDSEFNEIFLDDAVVPLDHVVGEVNGGWAVAVSLLNDERKSIGSGNGRRAIAWPDLRDLVLESGRHDDQLVRDRLVNCYVGQHLASLMPRLVAETVAAGRDPGAEASIGKVWRSINGRAAADLVSTLVFDEKAGWDETSPLQDWAYQVLDSCALSLGGGTDDIQYNALADHALALPRDPYRIDHLPFDQLPTAASKAH